MLNNVDYQTGWLLVDLNAALREPVIIGDAGGKLWTRGFQNDQGFLGQFQKQISWLDPNAPKAPVPARAR